ncbi:glycolate and propanediol utilization protein [Candidatus Kinetoplastibacterium blastocrithidii TCC012E]|uniref:Glycolate and propanediol utilization protein n=1 Tax=Candidatus Kinetoplastidibacterium blastocrithidiae TCC012E TaxID=1208922 RepID=M1MDS3_9PROT|nr:heme-binding protein [Candidatus Kinetoplastibacterium blastocrithidii]AFZ83752.1 GlcG protein [Candidatus Kinetoplastibacterium blastocrithidii (ex Strigomonas culicis)]AGF49875.1 glycolate and propanediol utilization protein [Candidatus Kinetoplastibacterium blastocrithidii TCC012E]
MKSKYFLTADDVKLIIKSSELYSLNKNLNVAISVVDDGGHLLGMLRLDGAPAISSHISLAKAKTSALGRRESLVYEEIINSGRYSFLSAPIIEGMLEGGVPIIIENNIIGAVGVSGAKSNEDADIARAGIDSLIAV